MKVQWEKRKRLSLPEVLLLGLRRKKVPFVLGFLYTNSRISPFRTSLVSTRISQCHTRNQSCHFVLFPLVLPLPKHHKVTHAMSQIIRHVSNHNASIIPSCPSKNSTIHVSATKNELTQTCRSRRKPDVRGQNTSHAEPPIMSQQQPNTLALFLVRAQEPVLYKPSSVFRQQLNTLDSALKSCLTMSVTKTPFPRAVKTSTETKTIFPALLVPAPAMEPCLIHQKVSRN